MTRQVIHQPSPRCPACLLPDRWCLCGSFQTCTTTLRLDVLIHYREALKPSSTGLLLRRVLPSAGLHVWTPHEPLRRDPIADPVRELWILHPGGQPIPPPWPPAAQVQVLLLDGNWRQAGRLLERTRGWGRAVALPMPGPSRYWLRSAPDNNGHCTVEAAIHLLDCFGENEARDILRRQFEIFVQANLLARGKRSAAAHFAATSVSLPRLD